MNLPKGCFIAAYYVIILFISMYYFYKATMG